MKDKYSYTAADIFPIKVLMDRELQDSIKNTGMIIPRHIQLAPTNLCNQNCSYCSCDNRSKKDSLSLDEIKGIVNDAKDLGCVAMTITGGGEPLMHSDYLLQILKECGKRFYHRVVDTTAFSTLETDIDTLQMKRQGLS